jgi:hypothetical protein
MKTKLITFLLFIASLPAAPILVTFDTSAISGQTGTVDIQFNPGDFGLFYEAGTATITAFELGTGLLGSISAGPDGGASGSLPGPLAIVNSDFLNGIAYGASFGSTASFLVEFSGNALAASGQSNFTTLTVSLVGTTTLSAIADLIGDGTVDTSLSSAGVGFSSEVPEPSTFGLVGVVLAAGAAFRRRRS